MSLTQRLTFLYSLLVGAILLIFGATTFWLVNTVLLSQVDDRLAAAANEFIALSGVTSLKEIRLKSPENMDAGVSVQVWGLNNDLQDFYGPLGNLNVALDPANIRTDRARFREVVHGNRLLRVLSVPLGYGGRQVAVMQVAVSLDVIRTARDSLLFVLFILWLSGLIVVSAALSLTLGRALEPIQVIVETAEQINRADDLSRRIPLQGSEVKEIHDLIQTFNRTLERLERLFTSQQRFLADVSHELRTPLTVIKGNVDLMRRMRQFDDESLTSIDQEAGRLTRLVGGLLMLAQAESGNLPLNFQPVELDLLLTEVFQEMHVIAGGRVRVHLTEIDQLQVNGDRDRLKQVLINLVANAIQYTPAGGEVFLSLARVGEQARIVCRDTGAGIPAEDLPHIFERFYRAEKSRTRSKTTGFGLGLSITKWIVEHHNGRIEVDSKEGQGTTFIIYLPLLKP
jgi:signal transduction histidine kinase